jgi:hypothetical protein
VLGRIAHDNSIVFELKAGALSRCLDKRRKRDRCFIAMKPGDALRAETVPASVRNHGKPDCLIARAAPPARRRASLSSEIPMISWRKIAG